MREMKDSGHETIGLVPSDWTEKRLKYLCKIQTGNEDTQNANPEGKYPFYVRSPIVEHCDRYTFDGEGILVAGDGAGAGRIFHHVYGKYAVHQRVYRLSHFAGNADFIYYYLSNLFPHEMDKGSAQSTVPSMRLPMLLNFPLFLPSKKEQDKIVTFLDSKCSEIDAISADIQKEIETLEQYKRSVITEAVTKGLNPDVKMESVNIQYIVKKPSNWGILRLKYVLTEQKARTMTGAEDLLSVSQYKGVILATDNIMRTMQAASLKGYRIVHIGDLVFNKLNPGLARFGASDYNGITSPDYAVYKANPRIAYAKYLEYILKTERYVSEYKRQSTGVGDGFSRLYTYQLYEIKVALPPIDEQKEIIDYLQSICYKIETAIQEKKKQVDILNAYKKSLIYEYVTGKKEVPNEQ